MSDATTPVVTKKLCPVESCKRLFVSIETLEKHFADKRTDASDAHHHCRPADAKDVEMKQCGACDKVCVSQQALDTHVRRKHLSPPPVEEEGELEPTTVNTARQNGRVFVEPQLDPRRVKRARVLRLQDDDDDDNDADADENTRASGWKSLRETAIALESAMSIGEAIGKLRPGMIDSDRCCANIAALSTLR